MPEAHEEPTQTEHFLAFLKAADRVALTMLLTEGISPFTLGDRNTYYCDIEDLAKHHGEPYHASNIDDVVTMQEMFVKVDAAHMVGIAIGLRLGNSELLDGGAR